jgi:hypothetical protein
MTHPSQWEEHMTYGYFMVKAVYRLIMDESPKKSHSWIYFLQHFLICMGNFGVSPRYPQMVSLPGMVPSGHTVTSVFRGGDDRNQFDQLSSSWSGRGGEFNWEALLEGQIKGPMWSFFYVLVEFMIIHCSHYVLLCVIKMIYTYIHDDDDRYIYIYHIYTYDINMYNMELYWGQNHIVTC